MFFFITSNINRCLKNIIKTITHDQTSTKNGANKNMFKSIITPIHPAGWPFIIIFLIASIIFWAIAIPLGVIGIILTLWCSYFFRNPDRVTPTKDGLIICPADGIVQMVSSVKPPTELSMGEEPICRVL